MYCAVFHSSCIAKPQHRQQCVTRPLPPSSPAPHRPRLRHVTTIEHVQHRLLDPTTVLPRSSPQPWRAQRGVKLERADPPGRQERLRRLDSVLPQSATRPAVRTLFYRGPVLSQFIESKQALPFSVEFFAVSGCTQQISCDLQLKVAAATLY